MTVTQDRADRLDEEVLAYVDETAPRYEVSRLFGRIAYVAPATAATRAVGRRQT